MRGLRWKIIGLSALAALLLAGTAQAAPPVSSAWQKAPVVPRVEGGVKSSLLGTVAAGEKRGMRSAVFAKAGDSNTEMSTVYYGLGCRRPVLGRFRILAPVIRRYRQVSLDNPLGYPGCLAGNSFARRSAATKAQTWTGWSATRGPDMPPHPYWQTPSYCRPADSPLICEIRQTRPRYVFVMTGTNDIGMDLFHEIVPGSRIRGRLLPAIRQARTRGVVPVLSTIPPVVVSDPAQQEAYDDAVARTNLNLWRLARERKLPLVNLWRALNQAGMKNRGMSDDGLHLSVAGANGGTPGVFPGPTTFTDSVDLTARGLRFGSNRRNLILLLTLARLDRVTRR